MNTSIPRPSRRHSIGAMLATGVIITICGCNLSSTAPVIPYENTNSPAANIAGNVHGGQQPVYNATVSLYAAGTTGYGSASTLLATTVSDANGDFQFTKSSVNGPSAGNTSSWACPVSTADPQIYITAVGGNTQGTGVISTSNSASALMAAIGPCSTVSTSTVVNLNEISTVATVFALAQYINPGTTPGTESIGTNAPNLTTSPAQAAVGLNNAVSTIANLANISTGQPVSSTTYTGSNPTVTSVTVTATPESAKLITIANILASCINTAASSSSQCKALFGAAVPPPTPSTTSQPNVTFAAAQDTIQAAYYMAVNPTDNTVNGANTSGTTTNLGILFALPAGNSPFQTGLTAQPSDWTIGVEFTSPSLCLNTAPFLDVPYKEAVDASGNLWFTGYISGATANISEMSPNGLPLYCNTVASTWAKGTGLTIDPTGNVWAAFDQAGVAELPFGSSTLVSWKQAYEPANTSLPAAYDITSDANGNIFYTSGDHSTTGGKIFEYPSPGSITTPFYPTLNLDGLGILSGTTLSSYALLDMAADTSGNIWTNAQVKDSGGSNYDMFKSVPTSFAINGFYVQAANSATFCTTAAPTFTIGTTQPTGQYVFVNGLTTTAGAALNRIPFFVTSVASGQAPCTGFSFTGTVAIGASSTAAVATLTPSTGNIVQVDSGTVTGYSVVMQAMATETYGVALDSNNYIYTGTACCSASSTKEMVRVSPANTAAVRSSQYLGGNMYLTGIAVDGAGNQWINSYFPAVGTPGTGGYGQATYAVAETFWNGTAFSALSPTGTTPTACNVNGASAGCPTQGGYQKSSFLSGYDMAIDPSGNVWVPASGGYNTVGSTGYVYTGNSITEIVGAAVPVITPLSVAAATNLGTKP